MIDSNRILGVIPARGGSKSVYKKNIYPLGGVPLIAYTIAAAMKSNAIDDVIISTDDEEIKEVSERYGGIVPFMRPPELSTDTALAIPTIQHAVAEYERMQDTVYDYICMLQPTTPFRTAEDLDEAFAKIIEEDADGLISVIHVNNMHPMKMKKFLDDGRMIDYEKPPVENPPRQSLPPVYMVNGALYATKRNVFMERGTFQGGRCTGYIMPPERSVNIDHELDFIYAEAVLQKYGYTYDGVRP